MKFLEKDLEDIIWEASNERLQENGLDISGKKYRQLRIGNYGIADIVSVTKPYYHEYFKKHQKGIITIYELKKELIKYASLQVPKGSQVGTTTFTDPGTGETLTKVDTTSGAIWFKYTELFFAVKATIIDNKNSLENSSGFKFKKPRTKYFSWTFPIV
jgi:hypothetical protein